MTRSIPPRPSPHWRGAWWIRWKPSGARNLVLRFRVEVARVVALVKLVGRVAEVNRITGDPADQLHERHDASDFDTKTQDKIAGA
jgi:hypothetical protein